MIKAIKSIFHTLTDTFTVVGRAGSYSLYPLLAYIVMLLVTFTALIPQFSALLGAEQKDWRMWVLFFLMVYLAYGVLYLVVVFCNVTLVMGIAMQLDGSQQQPTGGPLAQTFQRLQPIVLYTGVASTLGLLSSVARAVLNPFFGGVITPLVGDKLWQRWHQLSHNIPLQLAVPIIALDPPSTQDIFKCGEVLVKETWGERVKPAHSVSLLGLLVLLPVIVIYAAPTIYQAAADGNPDQLWLGLCVLLITLSSYIQISTLVDTIFALAAYRYATARKSDLFPGDPSYAEHAFVQPKKETDQDELAHQTT